MPLERLWILIAGNVLFVGGTKIRAHASASRTHGKTSYEEQLRDIDHQIESLLKECETIDQQEEDLDSYVTMDKELAKTGTLKSPIVEVLSEFKQTQRNWGRGIQR